MKKDYNEIVFDIDLIISMIDEIDYFLEPMIEEFELKDLHLQDPETIAGVERAIDTLNLIEIKSMEDEYFDSVFSLIVEIIEDDL